MIQPMTMVSFTFYTDRVAVVELLPPGTGERAFRVTLTVTPENLDDIERIVREAKKTLKRHFDAQGRGQSDDS